VISKEAASVPVTVRLFTPRPSSVTTMSATRIGATVLVFSAMEVMVLLSATAVGAAFGTVDGA
jgi:hypothetical protein